MICQSWQITNEKRIAIFPICAHFYWKSLSLLLLFRCIMILCLYRRCWVEVDNGGHQIHIFLHYSSFINLDKSQIKMNHHFSSSCPISSLEALEDEKDRVSWENWLWSLDNHPYLFLTNANVFVDCFSPILGNWKARGEKKELGINKPSLDSIMPSGARQAVSLSTSPSSSKETGKTPQNVIRAVDKTI